jgi:hypothetical protein
VCENCDHVFPEEPAHVEIFGATEQLEAPAIPDFRYAYTTLKFCVVLETFFFFKGYGSFLRIIGPLAKALDL